VKERCLPYLSLKRTNGVISEGGGGASEWNLVNAFGGYIILTKTLPTGRGLLGGTKEGESPQNGWGEDPLFFLSIFYHRLRLRLKGHSPREKHGGGVLSQGNTL